MGREKRRDAGSGETAVGRILAELGKRFTYRRGAIELDSASLATKAQPIDGDGRGEPLVIVEGTSAIAIHVTAVRPVQTDSTAATDPKQRLTGERIGAGIQQRQATLRSTARSNM